MVRLRDGSSVDDLRLGRLVQFDEQSRAFPIRAAGVPVKPRSYTWRVMAPWVIDQYREGACVGLCIANEAQCRPAEVVFGSKEVAEKVGKEGFYWGAQRIDQWQGGSYPGASPRYEGTSVLAGMKTAQQLGYFRQYRWAFGLQDVVYGIGRNGPAVLGINWYDSMYRPNNGWISPRGSHVVGGHAILARAVKILWLNKALAGTWAGVDLDRSYVVLRNSWGISWGDHGDAKLTLSDLGWLLDQQGEAVFAVDRVAKPRVGAVI
jgi:hypothetical protein